MYLKLAWRNIWRNKRRTFITIASIFFALLLAIVTRSMQTGTYDNMIKNAVSFFTGYIQIHKAGYWDEQVLDNSMELTEELEQKLAANKDILHYVPRLESFALASSGENTKGTLVIGIDPEKENYVTNVADKVVEGAYFSSPDEDGVLLAEGMAETLELGVNDTLVLFSQGYHGVTAAGKYPIKGLIHFGSPELNSNLVYLPIKTAQQLYSTGDLVTSVVLMLKDPANTDVVDAALKSVVDLETFEVMTWKEMLPDMVQMIEVDSVGGVIMIGILYTVISFGIFGTLLMMVNERRHEFGILISIGMKKVKLSIIVVIETLIMAGLAALVGMLGAIPIVSWFHNNPIQLGGEMAKMQEEFGIEAILPFAADPMIFFNQAALVLLVSAILALYPFFSILSIKPLEATRS